MQHPLKVRSKLRLTFPGLSLTANNGVVSGARSGCVVAFERIGPWSGPGIGAGAVLLTGLMLLIPDAQAATGETPAGTGSSRVPFEAATPVAVGAHVEKAGASVKLVFDLSRPVPVRAFVLENPDRIIVESSDINFQIPVDTGKVPAGGGGMIRSFRFGHFAPGKSRIVIDLAATARIQKIGIASIAGGDPSRLTVQLARCDRSAFRESVARADQPEPDPTLSAFAPVEPIADLRPVVVLDPGHGGIDPGAKGIGGVVEKRIVFDFAMALAAKLRASGRVKVVMTRADDGFVSLGDRVKVARDAKASLLVSLHADTLSNGTDVTGATVYTASDRASDSEAARVAETENKADEVAGLEATPDASDVSDILFDLTRRETRTFSHAFQHTLTGYWQKISHLNKNPERSAGFKVLQAPDVPSVLLELGYLSNEKDVAAMTSTEWRDKATASVAASIETFFASRVPAETAVEAPVDLKTGDADKTAIVVLRPHL